MSYSVFWRGYFLIGLNSYPAGCYGAGVQRIPLAGDTLWGNLGSHVAANNACDVSDSIPWCNRRSAGARIYNYWPRGVVVVTYAGLHPGLRERGKISVKAVGVLLVIAFI